MYMCLLSHIDRAFYFLWVSLKNIFYYWNKGKLKHKILHIHSLSVVEEVSSASHLMYMIPRPLCAWRKKEWDVQFMLVVWLGYGCQTWKLEPVEMKNTLFDYIEQIENVDETFPSMMKIFKLYTHNRYSSIYCMYRKTESAREWFWLTDVELSNNCADEKEWN